MGPLEFLVLELPGEALPVSSIVPAAERRTGRIAVLDSLVVIKEADGGIVTSELAHVATWRQAGAERTPAHVIGAADVNRVAERLAAGQSAVLLLTEQLTGAPAVTQPARVDRLAQLGEMLRTGALTRAEFETAKAQLLD
jgi:hypothetical protein